MLRPVSFSAISSTELKITFNKKLSDLITKDNFLIESIDGSSDGLEVSSVKIEDNVIVDAKFNSPNVYIKTGSFNELIQKGKELGATTVFKTTSEGYTVVDADFNYAYTYQIYQYLDCLVITLVGFMLLMVCIIVGGMDD